MLIDIISEQGNCLDIIHFDYTVRVKCFKFQPFQRTTVLSTCIKSSTEHIIDLLVIILYPQSSSLCLHATAGDMPAKNKKAKVLHHLEACCQPLIITNELVAKVIDCNAQLYVLSHIPDKLQGVADMVLDRLPKSSRVDFATDILKENIIKFLFAQTTWSIKNTFYLRPKT